ncbi:TraB/VirB10 family protein [Nostoc sp. CHAB 5834]|nr:TraB/VirB10 family protein [Nostoc sp. CHAB 5834]
MSDTPRKIFASKKTVAGTSGEPGGPLKQKDVKKRWLYVGGGAVALIVLSTTFFGSKNDAQANRPKKEKPAAMVSVNPPNADKAAFESRFAKEVEQLKVTVEQMKAEKAARDKELGDTGKPAHVVLPPTPPATGNTGGLGSLVTPPPAPPVPPTIQVPAAPALDGQQQLPTISIPSQMQSSDPLVFDAPTKASAAPAANGTPEGSANAKVRYQKNPNAGMLPAGAFAQVALLNGIDAGTGTTTQSNPMPVLMNITGNAVLPGSARYKLKNCFVLGSGHGDMSAERVYARVSRISCIDKNDRLVLSQEVQGYLVDSDGKLGMRGLVSDRQGAKLGKAMLAGFAQGLAGALGQAQSSVTSNLSTGTSMSSLSGGSALRASGLAGAQTATAQLADFYLKEAQAMFPVITIDAGRTGTIVFTSTTSLNWLNGDSQYVQQVTPTN